MEEPEGFPRPFLYPKGAEEEKMELQKFFKDYMNDYKGLDIGKR